MLQTEALEIMKTGVNVFLTGVPGAGKTYVVNQYISWLRDKGIYPAITASTGIAATHIGGRTIHSFVGIGVVDHLDDYVIDTIMQREKLYKKLLSTSVLIIDEISMLDAKTLDKVDTILRGVRKNPKPFGGIQVIFVGDFFQLPPVTKRGEETKYFAFMGRAWREAKPLTCYLEEQYRQTDETFTKLLLAIRENNIDEMHVEILEELKEKTARKFGFESPSPSPSPIGRGEVQDEPSIDYENIQVVDKEGESMIRDYRTGEHKNYDSLKSKAREMRKSPTPAEDFLWESLRRSTFGSKFRRQHVIGNFIVDFINLENKLVIEVDGGIHNQQKERDEERTLFLSSLEMKVLRFTNQEVLINIDSTLNAIQQALAPSLLGRAGEGLSLDMLELHSHNKNVDEINNQKLAQIKSKEYIYKMETHGRASLVENLIRNCLSPEILKLKKGAKVIFTKNDIEGKYVNGTMGVVEDLDDNGIVVLSNNKKLIELKREEWAIEEDGKVKARILQYPLRLAWAITVHKSQGMSLDEAIIDLGQTFEYGQGYVALSRVKTLEGLYLKDYNPKSLRVNEAISEYDEKIRKDSRFIQEKFEKADKKKLETTQRSFVEKVGGVWEGGVVKQEEEKKTTQEITLQLVNNGKLLHEVAEIRDIGIRTIISHLEDLYIFEQISKNDLDKILKANKSDTFNVDIFNIPGEVKKAFKKHKHISDGHGKIKLKPVFDELKEKYSYEELKFYRIFSS